MFLVIFRNRKRADTGSDEFTCAFRNDGRIVDFRPG